MSVLNTGDSMMKIATTEAQLAGADLPPAFMIAFEFKLSTGKAANIDKAGQAWRKASGEVEKAMNDLHDAVSRVSGHDWSGDDRNSYNGQVGQICGQLGTVHAYLTAAGMALTVYGYALFVYDIFAVAMGTFLAALAAVAAAAAAGVITAEITAACEEIAADCLMITSVATGVLAMAANLAAMVLQGGALVDAAVETHQGNTKAFGDLKTAEEVGAAAALANLGQNAINAGLAWVSRSNPTGTAAGVNVDLDADRDKDDTWNVGGGGTVKGVTAGAHVKYGDRGFMGEEVNGGYVSKGGWTTTGKAGVYVDHDGNRHVYGGGTAGWEQPTSGRDGQPRPDVDNGWGANVGANGDWNIDKGQVNGDGSVNVTNHGGTIFTGKDTVTHDEQGNVQNNPEVDTPGGDWRNGRYFV